MSRITIGTNLIEDCDTAITISGVPLFSYKREQKKVSLSFDVPCPPATKEIQIKDNIVLKGDVTLKVDSNSASVKLGDSLLIELLVKGDTTIVNLDLRPLGLRIYTDSNAFYIGSSQLSQNIIKQCAKGITIG
ncbi:MAG: hypothetical protein COY75_08120 [Nitrospirae bacterium CG_4_10_14_0_8_um_filter_41_23]|nr:hypothetical protein [Nitrospirota bacterium]OIP59064.1 MAG: hypothetical protein AUK38_06500 [Nitrospirae bacterium CG2_30_41_42]PIQ93319.1 MAG: hypothetical protein COV68_10700 [Nitrospirae bacterium CG11_big_fil_rev_8_21_14_0_20_41_14]PIV41037.1 MAG: hypothetical protein COS27_10795 [Nitrospirae bacterium CG02_land_8_20_14_3_00_41_53]PIW87448.1 MAG: hypothetical protein COZ94_05245 [Nitrospirae bacterium CG_4_8_14_3_um_filter_41_47]PIY86400.1 MAG: hypothetical protein COY75_08120 [Nitros